jgi:hypothetical protein
VSAGPAPDTAKTARAEGGAVALLRALDRDRRAVAPDAAADGEAVAALFVRPGGGPTVPVAELRPDAPIEPDTTIVLGEGVHDFSRFADAHRRELPAGLRFRGAGMDRTLLVIHEIGPAGAVEGLAFEDLTIDSRGHHFADLRGDEPLAVRMDRVRVVGFDSGPVASAMVAARAVAFLAVACRFEAGFGSHPGEGSLFHCRGPLIVRFEECVVRGPLRRVYEPGERGSWAFVGCRFEAVPPAIREELESPPANARFERCAFDFREPPLPVPAPRPLSDLHPDWR